MRGFSAVGRRAKIERLISQVSEQQKDLKERLEQLNTELNKDKTKEANKKGGVKVEYRFISSRSRG